MTNREIGSANVSGGIASTTYTIAGDETVGDFTLTGKYIENDTYKEATGTADFKVRIGTTITASNVIASHNQTSTFTATVNYNSVNPVDEGQVQFKLKGTIIGTASVSNGTASLDYQVPSTITTGDEITANYLGTNTYGASVTSTPATIKIRTNPTVSVNGSSINKGDYSSSNLTYPVTVTDVEEDSIDEGTVKLYIDNNLINTQTSTTNHTFNCVINSSTIQNLSYGSHTIRAVYEQNDDYNSAEGTATLIIRTPSHIVAPNVSANASGSATLEVTVYDNNNVIVTEGQVSFTDPNSQVSNIVVGANGKATTSVNIPAGTTEGTTLTYTVQYTQTNNYEASSTSNIVITIRKGVVVAVNDVTANRGDIINLTASIKDLSENNVTTGTVTFTVDDS